ncbi:murein hydrolase activator EnvC family protein [Chryseobacterium taklimakanense]|uniref:Peptidase M23 n=1 Tax=Chryseobacterium taklimakanense TaxID=536441 RepID=A0A3G8WK26_9FLAO|nr:peptidoglycan DD-metalloendopeptidase family protein [Chryseobacterium taklimakanense]AZI19787.1 peptidase M23 [Chryseobacterium taklimakanense]
MTEKRVYLFLAIVTFCLSFGQTKTQLQKQNNELKKQIATINANLAKTKNEAKLSVAYLAEVQKKIALREKVYSNTQKEKKLIEDDIYLKQLEINRQKKELALLRKNYANVLVKAYKNKGVQNKVTFILSSGNLGEAIRRVQYLKSYSDYQDRKAAEIMGVATKIQKNIASRQKSVNDKNNILVSQKKELTAIDAERKQREILLANFKKNEAQLTTELQQKQTESRNLEAKIRAIIAEEIRIAKAKEEAERKEREEKERIARIAAEKEKARIEAENRARIAAAAEAKRKADEEARKLKEIADRKAAEEAERARLAAAADAKRLEDAKNAAEAERAEARRIAAAKDAAEAAARAKAAADKAAAARAAEADLAKRNEDAKKAAEAKTMTDFGVGATSAGNFAANRGNLAMPVYGTITHRFGRQPHPVFKNIVEENTGIKIAVARGTVAKCVYPGEVTRVFVDGGTKTVVVRHGSYFTIYSNLESTSVSPNQKVSAGTPVGSVGADFDGSYTLDFQIWNGTTPVDPLGWLR